MKETRLLDDSANTGAPAEDLSEEVRNGLPLREPEALQAFFDLYFDRIYGYIRRLIGEQHLAEDLTQEVLLHVHRAFPTYDPNRPLRPWVFTVATNKLRDHWRSRRHREAQTDTSIDRAGFHDELVTLLPRVDDLVSREEMAEELRRAIDGLPEGMRVTVLLRIYEEMSFEEIGQVIERSEVAVRKRYSRALEALRGVLGPSWRVHSEGS